MDIAISQQEDVYIGMNWGNEQCWENFYLARIRTFEREDEAGLVPGTEYIYPPLWVVETDVYQQFYETKNVLRVFYNIHNKN